jgi:hypothetical protein
MATTNLGFPRATDMAAFWANRQALDASKATKAADKKAKDAEILNSMKQDLANFTGSEQEWRKFANDKYRTTQTAANGESFGQVRPDLYDQAWFDKTGSSVNRSIKAAPAASTSLGLPNTSTDAASFGASSGAAGATNAATTAAASGTTSLGLPNAATTGTSSLQSLATQIQDMISAGNESGAKALYNSSKASMGFTDAQMSQNMPAGKSFTADQLNAWAGNPGTQTSTSEANYMNGRTSDVRGPQYADSNAAGLNEYTANPYLDNIAAGITRQSNQNLQENVLPGIGQGAQGAGAYGGSRQGIAEGLAIGRAQSGLNDSLAGLYGGDFNNSMNRNLQKYTSDQGYNLGVGNLGLGYQNSDNAYNLGLGNLALGNQTGMQNFYSTQRGLDLTQYGLGANMYGQGNSGNINAGTGIYNTGNQYLNAPANAMGTFNGLVNGYTGFGTTTGTNSSGGGITGAVGGAIAGANMGGYKFDPMTGKPLT